MKIEHATSTGLSRANRIALAWARRYPETQEADLMSGWEQQPVIVAT
ncbi:MAG: hypothetical protein JWM33_906 [Caulobacteraceae bacterium]|nr:hypothetical protein [Caulobacteraceae bacterium]